MEDNLSKTPEQGAERSAAPVDNAGASPSQYQVGAEINKLRPSGQLPDGFAKDDTFKFYQSAPSAESRRSSEDMEIVKRNTEEVNKLIPKDDQNRSPSTDRKPEDDLRDAAYRYLNHHECLDRLSEERLKSDTDMLKNHKMPDGKTLKDTLDQILKERRKNGVQGGPECQYVS